MKIKFLINSNSDSDRKEQVSFLYSTTNKELNPYLYTARGWSKRKGNIPIYKSVKLNTNGEFIIRTDRLNMAMGNKAKIDPTIEQLGKKIKTYFFVKRSSGKTHHPFASVLTRKYKDGNCSIYFNKSNSGSFTLNGTKLSKTDLITILSKIIIRATICDSASILEDYIDKLLTYPPNVLYVLENRTPYTFYDVGAKYEVMINTKDIGSGNLALEISDGIWGTISMKDMNIFVNTFKHGSERSKKWNRISPRRLWKEVMGTDCSEAQLKLMIAWLKQNRTQDMVNKRAEELLHSLNNVPNMSYFPNILLRVNSNNINFSECKDKLKKAILVRGEMYDWLLVSKITNNQKHTSNRNQSVESYIINKRFDENSTELLGFPHGEENLSIRGRSICIDNVQNNSSIGDQLSTRAYIAMNDKTVSEAGMIHTIPSPSEEHDKYRLTDDEFNSLKEHLRKYSDGWLV